MTGNSTIGQAATLKPLVVASNPSAATVVCPLNHLIVVAY